MSDKQYYHCEHNCNVDGVERCPTVFESAESLAPKDRYCPKHRKDDKKADDKKDN